MRNKTKRDILLTLTILFIIMTLSNITNIACVIIFGGITIILAVNTHKLIEICLKEEKYKSEIEDDDEIDIDDSEIDDSKIDKLTEKMNTKKCKYCMSEIDINAKICPNCRKTQSFSITRVTIGVILGLIILFIIGSLYSPMNTNNNYNPTKMLNERNCYITLSQYNKIVNGMTYDEIANIIGCDGTVSSESEIADNKTKIYIWYTKYNDGDAMFYFQNDILYMKAQYNL